MQGTSWISFFRRIPVNLHDCLALTVTTGAEIVLQRIVKLEDDFAIVRGRMAGTQDGGRVVVLPYALLVSVAFNRRMTDVEVQAIFGEATPMAAPIDLSAVADAAIAEPAPEETPAEDAAVEEEARPTPAKPPIMPSKSVLLAKLRARLADGNNQHGK
jgi:hypothetical protein